MTLLLNSAPLGKEADVPAVGEDLDMHPVHWLIASKST
jgi:hypothetical protein